MSLADRMRSKPYNREAPKASQDPGPKSVADSINPLLDLSKKRAKSRRPPIWMVDGK